MNELTEHMHIRCFEAQDADIYFRIRRAAFIQKFYDESGARATSAGVNAFIPEYNSEFYRKVGFSPTGNTVCRFPAMDVPALRLEKKLDT